MRLHDVGLPPVLFDPLPPGPLNATADVPGVRVGHTTLIEGEGPLEVGRGPVRTELTVVHPRPGLTRDQPCFAGMARFNGDGDLSGAEWLRESGTLTTPVALTNTHALGTVRDAMIAWEGQRRQDSALEDEPYRKPGEGAVLCGAAHSASADESRTRHCRHRQRVPSTS